ncbi:hypothetical protein NQ317_009477 [Molorchus minor]|uniref:Uncharacterized protein n=1 Tax=Molorchus minor TaxID=1323400 RepID=A0ABQ9JLM9_9CUCU|nr:hypothetical protein NQ317_009477 [Molorchus minor]
MTGCSYSPFFASSVHTADHNTFKNCSRVSFCSMYENLLPKFEKRRSFNAGSAYVIPQLHQSLNRNYQIKSNQRGECYKKA